MCLITKRICLVGGLRNGGGKVENTGFYLTFEQKSIIIYAYLNENVFVLSAQYGISAFKERLRKSFFCDAEGVVFSFAFYTRMRTRKPDGFSVGPFSTEKAFFIYQLPGACLRKGRCSQVRKSRILAVLLTILLHNSARLVRRAIRTAMRSTSKHRSFPFIRRGLTVSFSNFNRELSTTLISLSTRTTRTTTSASTVFIR